ncbi:MAG: RidA family protein [Planctomycetota bacterium]
MVAHLQPIEPEGWARGSGYSNGLLAPPGAQLLFVAGQIGWDAEQRLVGDAMGAQFRQALANVMAVITTAGGTAAGIARMTVYVTDKQAYLAARKEIGAAWKELIGRHYPAMTLVQVADLLEPGAQVEIEVTAVV